MLPRTLLATIATHAPHGHEEEIKEVAVVAVISKKQVEEWLAPPLANHVLRALMCVVPSPCFLAAADDDSPDVLRNSELSADDSISEYFVCQHSLASAIPSCFLRTFNGFGNGTSR